MYEYTYGICSIPDEEVFHKQCRALEKRIEGIMKVRLLTDVDGSLIQLYSLGDKKIKVVNSYYIGDVHIDSEIDIEPFFAKI